MNFTTRAATRADLETILTLLPRLADFDVPAGREPEMLWASDAALLRQWADGESSDCFVLVGDDPSGQVAGVAIVSMGKDFFSSGPSAHLEVIVVSTTADGHGLGRRLIVEAEVEAASRGAQTMSLHVFGNNVRARHIYEKLGYDEELIRATKFLPPRKPRG